MWPLGPGVQASPRDDAQSRATPVKLHEPCERPDGPGSARPLKTKSATRGPVRRLWRARRNIVRRRQPNPTVAADDASADAMSVDSTGSDTSTSVPAGSSSTATTGNATSTSETMSPQAPAPPLRPEPMSVRWPPRPAPTPRQRPRRRIFIPSRRRTDRPDMKKGRSREGPAPVLLPATRLMRRRRRPFSSRRRSAEAEPCPR